MEEATHFTIPQLAQRFEVPAWKVRRVVDSLNGAVPRAGLYRLVPGEMLGKITSELHRQGWLPKGRVENTAKNLDNSSETLADSRRKAHKHLVEETDSRAGRLIRRKARQLIGRLGLTVSDMDDLEQGIRLDLWNRLGSFDPERSSELTFVRRVVDHQIASVVRARRARKRGNGRSKRSLDSLVRNGDSGIAQSGSIGAGPKRVGTAVRSETEVFDLKEDLRAITSGLPPDLRRLCEVLPDRSISQIAREGGVSRHVVRQCVARIRQRFAEAGLDEYAA